MAPAFIVIDGKRYAWRDILKLRREQRKAMRHAQLTLFEMKDDRRPASQRTADGRYEEPTLFKVD
jgi:hypothetical protein